jgi:hypothetical protein
MNPDNTLYAPCLKCKKPRQDHANDKCLFEPGYYTYWGPADVRDVTTETPSGRQYAWTQYSRKQYSSEPRKDDTEHEES